MARKHFPTIPMPHDLLKGEIDKWVKAEEGRNFAFLKAMCQAFQDKLEEYYQAGATPEDRLQRLEEICQSLIETGFTDGNRIFTIAAQYPTPVTRAEDLTKGAGCPEGRECIRGACV